MVSRIDSPTGEKKIFKKRAHRPWKPALLEKVIHSPVEGMAKEYESDLEVLEQTLEQNLEIQDSTILMNPSRLSLETVLQEKSTQRKEIVRKLSNTENVRITMGGFLQPKNIIFDNEDEVLQQTSALMTDLRDREQEIRSLKDNLKIIRAEEQAQQAETARLSEAKAREAAEEKAVYALSKAQQATEATRVAEEKAYLAEQTAFKLEQTMKQLKEKLDVTEEEYDRKLKYLQEEYQGKLEVTELKYRRLIATHQELENSMTEKTVNLTDAFDEMVLARTASDEKIMMMSEEMNLLKGIIQQEKDNSARLETEIASLHDNIHQNNFGKSVIEAQRVEHNEQIRKMVLAINAERNLRKLYEVKAKEIASQMIGLEIQRRSEEERRKLAEEKTKQTIEQASKAMMQLLNGSGAAH